MPDIFVPRDTSQYSPYFNKVVNYGYIYQFAFQYTDKNRNALKNYKNWKEMDAYLSKQNLLPEFTAFVASKGLKPVQHDLNISKNLILNQIKAYIIRNMLGENDFFPMINKDDITVKKAVEALRKL
jgi:carboxyl-terminal processing protease